MVKLLKGEFKNVVKKYIIVDCRFPFEYNAGHIKDAINIYLPQNLEQFCLKKPIEDVVLIFHCEYSQKRAPKLYRFLRELDRKLHIDSYPQLYYPNMYILEGGYRSFFEYCKVYFYYLNRFLII